MMKLEPIKALDTTARMNPIKLLEYMSTTSAIPTPAFVYVYKRVNETQNCQGPAAVKRPKVTVAAPPIASMGSCWL